MSPHLHAQNQNGFSDRDDAVRMIAVSNDRLRHRAGSIETMRAWAPAYEALQVALAKGSDCPIAELRAAVDAFFTADDDLYTRATTTGLT